MVLQHIQYTALFEQLFYPFNRRNLGGSLAIFMIGYSARSFDL